MPYLAHFGLKEHPFTLTPDVDYFFPTQEHANIIGSVEFALRRDTGIIKVVGPVGTGKTLLCRLLIKKLVDTEAVAYINAPRANANSIVLGVCKEFGLEVEDADAAYGALNRFLVEEHAKGRLAVLVVDEAQHLGREGLELVRLISNLETEKRKLLQIVMFGQTELDELLADPSLRQLTQRIAFSLATKPLTLEETKNYLSHRIRVSRREGIVYDVFTGRAVDFLARSCGGIPRVINIIADKSLLAAFAAGSPVVQPAHVAEAIKESPTLVNPVAPRGGLMRRLLGRAAMYFGGLIAVAVAAVVVLALIPAGPVSSGARAMLHSVGMSLTSISNPAVKSAPPATASTEPAATPTATPAPAVTVAQPAPPPAPAKEPQPTTPAQTTTVLRPAAAPETTTATTTATAPAAAQVVPATTPAATATTAPAAMPKPTDNANAATPATTPTAATATPSPTPAVADTPSQPSARAAMHKIKRPPAKKAEPTGPATQPKPDQASLTRSPATAQHADEAPKANASPRETVIVERISTPDNQSGVPAGTSAGGTRSAP